MPPAKVPDNLMIIVGQLLEATKAASEGLKSVSLEVQSNAKVIITASKTLEMVEEKVSELDEIIRDSTNKGNLVAVTQTHAAELVLLHTAVTELKTAVETLRGEIGKLGLTDVKAETTRNHLWLTLGFVGWLVTTAIALFAAFNGK